MLVNEMYKWVENEEEWFFDFLAEMTEGDKYGDDISGSYPEVEFDGEDFELSYTSYNRCGDSDYYYATIPLEDVVRKLRKEKLELIKNNI